MIIRLLLIAGVLVAVVLVLRGGGSSRQLAVRRIGLICFAAASVVAVIAPNSLTTVAHAVGVGRGTDLLLYTMIIVVLVFAAGLFQRMTRLEERITQLTREIAIERAEPSTRIRAHDDSSDSGAA